MPKTPQNKDQLSSDILSLSLPLSPSRHISEQHDPIPRLNSVQSFQSFGHRTFP